MFVRTRKNWREAFRYNLIVRTSIKSLLKNVVPFITPLSDFFHMDVEIHPLRERDFLKLEKGSEVFKQNVCEGGLSRNFVTHRKNDKMCFRPF